MLDKHSGCARCHLLLHSTDFDVDGVFLSTVATPSSCSISCKIPPPMHNLLWGCPQLCWSSGRHHRHCCPAVLALPLGCLASHDPVSTFLGPFCPREWLPLAMPPSMASAMCLWLEAGVRCSRKPTRLHSGCKTRRTLWMSHGIHVVRVPTWRCVRRLHWVCALGSENENVVHVCVLRCEACVNDRNLAIWTTFKQFLRSSSALPTSWRVSCLNKRVKAFLASRDEDRQASFEPAMTMCLQLIVTDLSKNSKEDKDEGHVPNMYCVSACRSRRSSATKFVQAFGNSHEVSFS